MKSPGSPRTELFVAPVGVASKRHLFEKELAGQSRAEPASSRKVRPRQVGPEASNPGPCLHVSVWAEPALHRSCRLCPEPRSPRLLGEGAGLPALRGPGPWTARSCPGPVAPSPDGSLSPQEHLKLSGVVTSRLNLWISRTQESGEQDSQVPVPPEAPSPLWWGGGASPRVRETAQERHGGWSGPQRGERVRALPLWKRRGLGGREPCPLQSA